MRDSEGRFSESDRRKIAYTNAKAPYKLSNGAHTCGSVQHALTRAEKGEPSHVD